MKLVDIIEHLMTHEKLEGFYYDKDFNLNSDEISIYMKDSINIDSEIYFFEVEETDGEVLYKKDGIEYIYFFPLEHTAELIQDELDLKNKEYTNLQIAQRLIQYRIYDA